MVGILRYACTTKNDYIFSQHTFLRNFSIEKPPEVWVFRKLHAKFHRGSLIEKCLNIGGTKSIMKKQQKILFLERFWHISKLCKKVIFSNFKIRCSVMYFWTRFRRRCVQRLKRIRQQESSKNRKRNKVQELGIR